MRRPRRFVALVLTLAACGQVEPVTMAVSMPECVYQGRTAMRAGVVSVSLTLNGITAARLVLGEISDDHTYDELSGHLDDGAATPSWVTPLLEVELSSTDGIDGVSKTAFLDPGSYVLICVDATGARLAAPMAVREP